VTAEWLEIELAISGLLVYCHTYCHVGRAAQPVKNPKQNQSSKIS